MNVINNAKIATKIAALLLLAGLITLAVSLLASQDLRRQSNAYNQLTDVMLPDTVYSARVNRRVTEIGYAAYRAMAYRGGTQEARDAAASEKKSYGEAIDLLTQIKKREPEFQAKLDEFAADVEDIHAIASKAVAFGLNDQDGEAAAALVTADAKILALVAKLKAFNDSRVTATDQQTDTLMEDAASVSRNLLITAIVSIIGGIVSSMVAAKATITGPLGRLRETMARLAAGDNHIEVAGAERGDEVGAMAKAVVVFRDMAVAKEEADAVKARADAEQKMVVETVASHLGTLADGDLTKDIEAAFPPAYGELKSNFNQAVDSLRTLIGSVSATAQTVRTGSDEIAHASEDLARRTEGNAASLEETSAAIHQIDSRLKATAEAADRSVAGSELTLTAVGEGRARTDQAVQAMGRVSDSAKGIDSVIEGLDKIAFQTRVLAMNAAVEAGRAGEAGRGFAVVADLVSALAMRAEEEAGRAREQLTVTQAEIVAAVDAVEKVDGALGDISNASREAAALARQIASDNQAQASAISQVSTAVGQMDEATQQNAAMVEQTSAAARNLTAEVANLTAQAAQFNVGNGAPSATAAAAGPTKVPSKPRPIKRISYQSPVQALPAKAAVALNRAHEEEWNSF